MTWLSKSSSQGGLPAPAITGSNVAHYGRSRARQRLLLALFCACAVLFLTTHPAPREYGRQLWNGPFSEQYDDDGHVAVWRPDLQFDSNGNLKEAALDQPDLLGDRPVAAPPVIKVPPTPAPAAVASAPSWDDRMKSMAEEHAKIPIRERPRPADLYPHALPSALDDPWPEKPFIADKYLAAHVESLAPPKPHWPDDASVKTKPLDKKLQVSAKQLFWPKGYKKKPLPGRRKAMPAIQHDFAAGPPESEERRREREARKEWVRAAMKHGWNGYKKHAWGHDELRPLGNVGHDAFNGWGATIIDSLDTLVLMDMPEEYNYARTHVQAVDFTLLSGASSAYGAMDGVTLPTFETTIRYLGGLLGAHDVTGDSLMLTKARELADWILGSFNSASGLPIGRYKLGSDPKGGPTGRLVLSEAGSMSLEYTRMWQLTGESAYYDVIQRATDFFDTAFESPSRLGRLLPANLVPELPESVSGTYSFSAQCDSYYEYLIKEHLLLGGGTDQYARMYADAMDSAHKYIIRPVNAVPDEQLLTVGENAYGSFRPTLDHLTCFAGAMMGIGAKLLDRPKDMDVAEKFSYTCFWAYNVTATGVGPESIMFYQDDDFNRYQIQTDKDRTQYRELRGDPPGVQPGWNMGYGGRPETIESVFYMYRITGDPVWQDRAWQMFVNWVNHTITPTGFAGLHHVGTTWPVQKDTQESFVFAETLKYYYLAFCEPDFLSLDDWVFNTEAHPFRLRPDEELKVPVSTWNGPNLETNHQYLEPAHGGTLGRGTSLQRIWRQAHPLGASTSAKPMPLAQAFNGGRPGNAPMQKPAPQPPQHAGLLPHHPAKS